jgi:hypothetical protein
VAVFFAWKKLKVVVVGAASWWRKGGDWLGVLVVKGYWHSVL